MTVTAPPPPPLPAELEALLRRLRLPYVRKAAPEVIANATAQRWEHAEVLRVLLAEKPPAVMKPPPGCAGGPLAAGRQDVRRLGIGRLSDPRPDPASAANAGMDRPSRNAGDLRAVGDRQEPLHRSARPPRDPPREDRLMAHARDARATRAPTPRRRQRQQSRQQAHPLRPDPDR